MVAKGAIMKYNIAFYCESIPFTAETCQLKHSLGGSETMLIGMAKELAKREHNVYIFTQFSNLDDQGVYDDVNFWDASAFKDMMPSVEWDIFMSLRMPYIMSKPVQAKARFLWNQDELTNPKEFMANLWQTDGLFFVSDWQKEHYCKKLPDIRDISHVTRNGVDLDLIKQSIKGVKKDPHKLIYISRPERGLEPLLQIFPQIKERCPEAKLRCARYYSMYEPQPNIKMICDNADKMMQETDGCEYLGNLSKEELYREIASSRLMVYPGVPNFNETGCIAAMEAQACGTPIVCSNKGGIMETVNDWAGVKINGNAYSEEYQARFVEAVLELLNDNKLYQDMQEVGRKWIKRYDYSAIAPEWEQYFDTFFEKRYAENTQRIYDNLIQYDDIVAANYLAKEQKMQAEIDESNDRLQLFDEDIEKHEYARYAANPRWEIKAKRFEEIIVAIATEIGIEKSQSELDILDFACGNGSLSVLMAKNLKQSQITAVDFSPELIAMGNEFSLEQELDDRIKFVEGSLPALSDDQFDVIVCGEFLEHCDDYVKTITDLESHLKPEGLMLFTMPYGPMSESRIKGQEKSKHRGHIVHWEWSDIQSVFANKRDFQCRSMPLSTTPRGNQQGHWIITYRGRGQTGRIDWYKKTHTKRPFQKLSVCMIARNDSKWVDLCMEQLEDIADEIIVATNGDDKDGTIDKLEKWDAQIIQLPLLAPGVPAGVPPPGNFSWLRNESIAQATGDWIMWVDLDERLTYPKHIRKYLETQIFNGLGVRQVHLSVDQPGKNFDTPIRVFRNNRGYQSYGCIHEHFEDGIDNPIHPSLEVPESELAHLGYLTESGRRFKCLGRNFQMLNLDRRFYPKRQMTDVLFARDHINFALWEITSASKQLTPQARAHCWSVVDLYNNGDWYNNPSNIYFKLIFGFYQKALKWLQTGMEFALSGPDGEKMRFLSLAEFSEYSKKMIDMKVSDLGESLFNRATEDDVRIPQDVGNIPQDIGNIPLPTQCKVV